LLPAADNNTVSNDNAASSNLRTLSMSNCDGSQKQSSGLDVSFAKRLRRYGSGYLLFIRHINAMQDNNGSASGLFKICMWKWYAAEAQSIQDLLSTS
jgi:hypothetical protein